MVKVELAIKKRLYGPLRLDGTTLKEWFRDRVETYATFQQGVAQEAADALPQPSRSRRRPER
ncbi:MAG: hypothetical protein HYV63_26090 [Candidatus Schekmanbacteria bacterium]|nr:hypothetical protein [Candidatus Schekmanbacteria bacterium]